MVIDCGEYPCPCGSGKKYKHCCGKISTETGRRDLPSGRFRYEHGSYGGPGRNYLPSILCYRQHGTDSWMEHFCLVKPDSLLEDEEAAAAIAMKHLEIAYTDGGGNPEDFALSLRQAGYISVSDFRVVDNNGKSTV